MPRDLKANSNELECRSVEEETSPLFSLQYVFTQFVWFINEVLPFLLFSLTTKIISKKGFCPEGLSSSVLVPSWCYFSGLQQALFGLLLGSSRT